MWSRFSSIFFPASHLPKGGILADEMGLGKTVEVLTLILAHRWNGPDSHLTSISGSHVISDNQGVDECILMNVVNQTALRREPNVSEDRTEQKGIATEEDVGEEEMDTLDETINEGQMGKVLCWCGSKVNPTIEACMQCNRCLIWQHITCSNESKSHSKIFICINCLLKEVKLLGVSFCCIMDITIF